MKSKCKIWPGRLTHNGYGTTRKPVIGERRAHRAAYAKAYGAIPKGAIVLHSCDVRSCVNPKHLKIGTPLENSRDMIAKGRIRLGSKRTEAKLNEENVREARLLFFGGSSLGIISKLFEVGHETIRKAVYGDTWKHVL